MIKRIHLPLVLTILLTGSSLAQFSYSWSSQNISVNSGIELQPTETMNMFRLEGKSIVIEFAPVGGMEGVDGLAPSLDSFVEAFDYTTSGKSREIFDIRAMAAARIEGKKAGKSLILLLLAAKDYQKHFTCEMVFPENRRADMEAIIRGIDFGTGSGLLGDVNGQTDTDQRPATDRREEEREDRAKPEPANDDARSGRRQEREPNQPVIGSTARDFTLHDITGEPTSLSSFRGKTVLLDFWGTWCMPCIQSIPKLKELYKKYGGSSFEIVSIANDVNVEKWENTVSARGMNWTNLIDQNENVCNLYEIKAYPTLFLIDKNGRFVAIRTDQGEVEEYLQQTGPPASQSASRDNNDSRERLPEEVEQQNDRRVENTHLKGTPVQRLTWQLLSAYSPDGYYILDEFYKSPTSYDGHSLSGDDDFTAWIDGESEKDVIKSLNTVVHEMDHGYTGRMYLKLLKEAGKPVARDGYSAFYLGNKETRLVAHTGVFVSREINASYPSRLTTSRYETYVYPSKPDMGSQQDGIYGLLDEWNAYYHGTRTSFDLYRYYKTTRDDASGWAEFFTGFYGTYYAYLEFKHYILVYMMHAKKKYPQLYQGFMTNQDLVYSLQKTDEIWTTMIVNFKELRSKIMADLIARGMEVEEKDGFTFINGTGTGNFSETYDTFQQELDKPAYQEMARSLGFSSAGGPDF